MRKLTLSTKVAGAAVRLGAIAMVTIGGPANVQAKPQNIESDWQHILNCADWLINDPARHADNCLPSNVAPLFGTLAPGQSSVPPVPASIVEDDCDPYDYYDDCYYYD